MQNRGVIISMPIVSHCRVRADAPTVYAYCVTKGTGKGKAKPCACVCVLIFPETFRNYAYTGIFELFFFAAKTQLMR